MVPSKCPTRCPKMHISPIVSMIKLLKLYKPLLCTDTSQKSANRTQAEWNSNVYLTSVKFECLSDVSTSAEKIRNFPFLFNEVLSMMANIFDNVFKEISFIKSLHQCFQKISIDQCWNNSCNAVIRWFPNEQPQLSPNVVPCTDKKRSGGLTRFQVIFRVEGLLV